MESATTPPWVRTKLAALMPVQASPSKKNAAEEGPGERSPAERGTLNLDNDEVSSEDRDFLESVTIKSMYVLPLIQP